MDQSIDVYSCETWGVNYSVIIWGGTVLLAFVTLLVFALFARGNNVMGIVVTKVKTIYSENLSHSLPKFANMSKMIDSLNLFIHIDCCIVASLLIFAIIVYPVIRYFDDYSTHYYQYIFEVSAVFKRGVPLGTILLLAFVALVIFINRVLSNTLTITSIQQKSRQNVTHRDVFFRFQLFSEILTKFLFALLFVSVVVGIDTLYVFGQPSFDVYEKSAVQFTIVVFNAFYKIVALPRFISRLYRDDRTRSLVAYAMISAFLDILSPCVATILIDDNCLRQYLYPASITTNYEFEDCILFFITNGVPTSCAKFRTTTSSYDFVPPFIYSNQCRNALISNFMWLIMSNSIVDTFLLPLVYLICNWNINSLAGQCADSDSIRNSNDSAKPNGFIKRWYHMIIQFVFYNPSWVLADISHSMVAIFEDFAMFTIYGLISPFCAVAIGTGLFSKIIILRVSIVRAYRLKQEALVQGSDIDGGYRDIDSLCGVALENSEALFWPSFVAATLFFAFFLWDMTSDSDEPVGVIPWVFLTVTPLAVLAIRLLSRYLQQESSGSIATHDQAKHWPGGVVASEMSRPSTLEMTNADAEDMRRIVCGETEMKLGRSAEGQEKRGEAMETEGTGRDEEDKQESEGSTTVNPLQV
jgi:hypothetical protein